ncbi:MAG: hypothetical protein CMF25_02400 [Kangiellaceae bacterium]|nr:hypothetical protein [Kangiellaceae bacterium]|tara:strand:- start:6300 stop:7076 length:777 start_codon:yes stop_codon:yes gene_type:complete
MQLIDSHCHLDRLDTSAISLGAIVDQARANNIEHILCVAIDEHNTPGCIELAEQYDLSSSAGIHPLSASAESDFSVIAELAHHRKVVAIGETGLDYYYKPETISHQQLLFKKHIQLACQLDKPIIVHTRDARQDTVSLLKDEGRGQLKGVIHCFTEDLPTAKAFLELGFYISFSGIVTFRNASDLRETMKHIPLERLLIETDAPYLTPVPLRGKPNYPVNVVHVAECVAQVKGISISEVAQVTTENYYTLFGSPNEIS